MLRPGRFARPASVRTFTLELSLPLSPSEASSMTTRVNSQFPRLDSHQLDTQHYGLRAKLNQQIGADRKANGGNLTNNEKARIDRRQNGLSNQIYQDKHNAA